MAFGIKKALKIGAYAPEIDAVGKRIKEKVA